METEHVSGFFKADFVVPDVVEVVDIEFDPAAEFLFNFGLHLIGNFSHGKGVTVSS